MVQETERLPVRDTRVRRPVPELPDPALGLSGSRPSGKKQYGRKPAENGAVCLQYSAVELIFCMALLALCILSMVSSTYSAFLYMNF